MQPPVELQVEGSIATVWLNDPATRNALSSACAKALIEKLRWVEAAEEVRVLILTGANDVFCSGANLTDRTVHTAESVGAGRRRQTPVFDLIAGCGKPTIAAISGPAVGAGANLALACDLRVCGEDAWLRWPQVGFGVMPGAGTLARLCHIVGSARALDWTMTGRRIGADEGLTSGLYARVVSPADVLPTSVELARLIASHPVTSVRFVREAVASLVQRDVQYTADADAYRSLILYDSPERKRASARWREERDARKGRPAPDGSHD